ncbi:hypothetical protein NUACC21_62910 [Scytonema sp. NUACC21]
MEAVWNAIKGINYSGILITKIVTVLVILTLAQVLRRLIVGIVLKAIERLTERTKSSLDDELVKVVNVQNGIITIEID